MQSLSRHCAGEGVRVRNLSDIRSDIFRGKFAKNFHGCPIQVNVRKFPLLVYSTEHISSNDSNYQPIYVEEWEVELVRVIGKALNMTLHLVGHGKDKATENLKSIPVIHIGVFPF
jgi:hypothetical protein